MILTNEILAYGSYGSRSIEIRGCKRYCRRMIEVEGERIVGGYRRRIVRAGVFVVTGNADEFKRQRTWV